MKHMTDNTGLNTGILRAVTRRVRLVEHEVLVISEHTSLLWCSYRSILVLLCVVCCGLFFASLPLYCLFFFGLQKNYYPFDIF